MVPNKSKDIKFGLGNFFSDSRIILVFSALKGWEIRCDWVDTDRLKLLSD